MTEEDKAIIKDFIEQAIRVVVNGKIDKLDKKIDEHNAKHEQDMQEIKPYMQAAVAFRVGAIGFKWLGGFLIALGTIIVLVMQIFHKI